MTSLLLLATGCASLSASAPALPTVEVPTQWSDGSATAAGAASAQADWWQRFDDPLLVSLVDRALRANTSVNTAQAALRQARALRNVAAAALLPNVTGSTGAQRDSAVSSTLGRRITANTFQAGFDASWELDIFGANRSGLRAAEASARASAASLGDVQVSIAAEVALNYMALRSTQARLAIAQANLASQRETLQITQWRLQAGLVTALDVEQARTAAEQTAASLPALQKTHDQTVHALSVLTGQAPAALTTALSVVAPLPTPRDDLALSIPAETLRQRADVRAAEWQLAAASARIDEAAAARWPNFSIGGSLGLSALTLGALTDGASVVGQLLASVSLPVFDGGARRAQVDAQQAAYQQSEQAYRAAVFAALQDVEDALVALNNDRQRLTRLLGAADAAASAATLARQQYGSGLIDFQTVLLTQRSQLSTQDDVASASADVGSDHVRLYKALGGGWTPDVPAGLPAAASQISRASTP